MATFTIELCELIYNAEKVGIDKWQACGLDTYPIFDESHRETLNSKIINHYYRREIGAESAQLFRLFMSRRMREIMPYYNQLYLSEKLEFDPLMTMRLETKGKTSTGVESTAESQTHADSSSESVATSSDYPQTQLSGIESYATSSTKSEGTSDTATTGTETAASDTKGESESVTSGYQGSPSDMLNAYRETFLNIDLTVITELEDLFMSVWNITEDYSWNGGTHDYS